jgi:hypothetical protein
MKVLTVAAIAVTMLSGFAAKADYKCVGDSGNSTINVDERFQSRIGNATIALTVGKVTTGYIGQSVVQDQKDDVFQQVFQHKIFKLYPFTGNQLSITQQPAFCGRGSCDDTTPVEFFGELILDGVTTYFSCHETTL